MTDSSATIDPTKAPAQHGGGSIGKLALALSKAQGTLKNAVKDASNPAFKRDGKESTYADLASVWDACRAALTANEIAVIQQVQGGPDTVTVSTVLAHSSGESISCSVTGKPTKNDVQGIGSTITYLRRYSLAAMVGVAPEDDDGNAASGKEPKAPVTPAEQKAVQKATEQKPKAGFYLIDGEGKEHSYPTGPKYLMGIKEHFKTAPDKAGFWESNAKTFDGYHIQESKVGGKAADDDFTSVKAAIIATISVTTKKEAAE